MSETLLPSIKGMSCVLAHAPGLVRHGSKPARELAVGGEALAAQVQAGLRGFQAAVAYPPNQAFIGNLAPESLWDCPRPWWEHGLASASATGPYGEIISEPELLALLALADEFRLVELAPEYLDRGLGRLAAGGAWDDSQLARARGKRGGEGSQSGAPERALPLQDGEGAEVGRVAPGHEQDASQAADVILENLAAKATGALAVRHLLRQTGLAADGVEYVLGCGEEAVGDRYQRGGGNLAKAVAEMAGCARATGADVKAFCCAPVHALVLAGALVRAGLHRHVVVVGGGSLAKLGMKFRGHLARGMPVLEDCLAAMAILVGPPDGENPRLRLDLVGRHSVGSGGSARAIYEALVAEPLGRAGLRIPEVDRYAVELHNPELTEPAGSGNVPRTNYRTLASLAVLLGQLGRQEIESFERKHGMPGYVPTQGHIPAALPYLAHARERMRAGELERAFFIAKGSLFLGKMTTLADGMSVLVERSR